MTVQATLGLVEVQVLLQVMVTRVRHSAEGEQDGSATQEIPSMSSRAEKNRNAQDGEDAVVIRKHYRTSFSFLLFARS